jgi:hypothetical protein
MSGVPDRLFKKPTAARLRSFLPALAFVAGFLWDSLTLGKRITSLDLFLLLGYFGAAAVILFALGRNARFRFSQHLNLALQFLFGGIFSALVIFYFLSASALPGYALVLALAALLVLNEFLESRYADLTLSWTLFAVCGVMLFNFALPHLFRSVSVGWFYLSTLAAIAVVVLLREFSIRERASLLPAIGIALLLLIAHAVNLIPPVPLVKKRMAIAHDLVRRPRSYEMQIEPPSMRFWPMASGTVHWLPGRRIYCFTSVFVPIGISTTVTHVWERRDPVSGRWMEMTRLTFPIRGGRSEGFRGVSWKENLSAGAWRVRAESASGATIGVVRFEVVRGTPPRLERVTA